MRARCRGYGARQLSTEYEAEWGKFRFMVYLRVVDVG